jgi:hypothetical protein
VWLTLSPQAVTCRVLDPDALLPPEVLARSAQEARQALMLACQVGPVAAAGITELQCTNPTARPLVFEAEWHFAGNAGRVEPQMLGFALEPGQSLRQRFRLQADGNLPLKFVRPRLNLTTSSPDGLGRPVPVRLLLAPPVRLGGPVGILGTGLEIDGNLSDWPFGGYPLGHESQVVLARQPWRGLEDLSAVLYVGETDGRLCAALALRRQAGTEVSARILLDPRGGEGADFSPAEGPVTVTVTPAGQVETDGCGPVALETAWRPTQEGGVLEIAFPTCLFPGGSLPATVLLDAVLTSYGSSGDPVTVLCFSGAGPGLESSRLYGQFQYSLPPDHLPEDEPAPNPQND